MSMLSKQAQELIKAKEELQEKRSLLQRELPHLYGWKWYPWAKSFFETTNQMALLCAANQISKSTTQIRKHVHWATARSEWKGWWKTEPRQFWYLYPSADVATAEFQTKWAPDIMPKKGQYISEKGKEQCIHPVYGWKALYDKKKIHAIEWASGVVTYFKTYAQNVHTLQSGTVHRIDCDEELPEELFDELMFRLQAVDGYFSMVFTATRNQVLWLLAMETTGEMEKFPDAFKLQISMEDCKQYEDGSEGHYNDLKIARAIAKCKNKNEVLRRVHGRFVQDQGRKYGTFDPAEHFVKPHPIPKDWLYYGGVDIGSGGAGGHPSAMGIIAVAPDFSSGRVIRGWRGDGIETTAGDTLQRFIDLRQGLPRLTAQVYDWAAKDFFTIATRMGESFLKAEKSHEIGEQIVNTLFKNNMLKIFDTAELRKLGTELMTLMVSTPKNRAKDDLIDGALRYPAASIPWDWSKIPVKDAGPTSRKEEKKYDAVEDMIRQRRGEISKGDDDGNSLSLFNEEVSFWNSMYG